MTQLQGLCQVPVALKANGRSGSQQYQIWSICHDSLIVCALKMVTRKVRSQVRQEISEADGWRDPAHIFRIRGSSYMDMRHAAQGRASCRRMRCLPAFTFATALSSRQHHAGALPDLAASISECVDDSLVLGMVQSICAQK